MPRDNLIHAHKETDTSFSHYYLWKWGLEDTLVVHHLDMLTVMMHVAECYEVVKNNELDIIKASG